MTLLEHIGEWAAALTLDDVPPTVLAKVRLQVATSMSAAAWTPWHGPAQAVLAARRSAGGAAVLATGDRLAPADAAFVNAAFAMALDHDDYMLCGHTGYSAVLAPLAHASRLDQVLLAAVVANELEGRLSTACLLGPLNGQMSSYIHNGGAALAVGRVWGLDATALATAVSLALYQPSHCLAAGFWHEGAKTLTASLPLEQGIRAAELARAGLTGPLDLLEHPLGFLSTFSFGRFDGLFEGLGRTWFSETLCYKRYPGTSYVSAPVEGALAAWRALGEPAVDQVLVRTTALSSTLDSLGAAAIERSPLDANAVNFSVRLSVAAALHFGDLLPEHLRPEHLAAHETAIRALAERVVVEHELAQTLRLFTGNPLGSRMLFRLGPTGLGRLYAHGRRMNRSSGRGNSTRWRGVGSELPTLVRQALSREPVSDLGFDAAAFEMRQSATVTVRAGGEQGSHRVDVPIGACGRDAEETRDLVRWRCAQAFGEGAERYWELLHGDDVAVDALVGAIC